MRTLLPRRSREREPITGAKSGAKSSGVQGQSPWSWDQGAEPPELERLLASGPPMEAANLPFL